VSGFGRLWLRFGVAGALVVAIIGNPLLALVVTVVLTLLEKIESRS
jgi:hypothetical protein